MQSTSQPLKAHNVFLIALTVIIIVSGHFAARAHQQTSQHSNHETGSEIARLTSALKSSDEEERRAAALTLAWAQSPAATAALLSALSDRSERVRAAAIASLAWQGDPMVAPHIAARLAGDKSYFVRKTAAYALGRLKTREGTIALVAALNEKPREKNLEVRSAAVVALGEYADAAAIEPLTRALDDKLDFIRARAALALGANGRNAAQAVPRLIKLLGADKENSVKRQAAIALGRIGERSALPALHQAQRDPDPYLSRAALEAIAMIEANQKDQS